jgi:hypothetical protein
MAARTSLPLHEVETEIDRYISWAAQALSYKLGEMKIRSCGIAPSRHSGPVSTFGGSTTRCSPRARFRSMCWRRM